MRTGTNKKLLIIPSFLILLLLFGVPAYCTQEGSLGVSPTKMVFLIPAGEREVATSEIIYTGEKPTKVKVSAVDFMRDDSGKLLPLDPDESELFGGCSSWITFPRSIFHVVNSKTSKVYVNIRVPERTKPGTCATYLLFKPYVDAEGEAIIRVLSQVASLVKVMVPGDNGKVPALGIPKVHKQGRILYFRIPEYNFGKPIFRTSFNNNGNVHLNAEHHITIYNRRGKAIAYLASPRKTIKPGTTELFTVKWKNPPLLGKFRATGIVDIGLSLPLEVKENFWIFSTKLIVPITLLIVASILYPIFRRSGKHSKKRRVI